MNFFHNNELFRYRDSSDCSYDKKVPERKLSATKWVIKVTAVSFSNEFSQAS